MNVTPLVGMVVVGAVLVLNAQSLPTFDVVSVKPNTSGTFPVGPEARRGGSFVATNVTLVRLVRFAYGLPEYRVAGGPEWIRRDRFDVEARVDREATAAEIQQMVQALLRDRFQLVARPQQRQGSTYTLLINGDGKRPGPTLRRSTGNCMESGDSGEIQEERRTPNGGVATRQTCVSMAALASSLSDALEGPVEDKTGLTGRWDYELAYTGRRRTNVDAAVAARDPNDAPALFTAVQEQLGLRLEAGREPWRSLRSSPRRGQLATSTSSLPPTRGGTVCRPR